MQTIQPIILAAGKGSRIAEYSEKTYGEAIPKVMLTLENRPLLDYILATLEKTDFAKPIVVVGFMKEKVKEYFGNRARYVKQKEQLGTGHAVIVCEKAIKNADHILVIYGDMPFWSSETLKSIGYTHQERNTVLTIGTVEFENPNFWSYGRIRRDERGNVLGCVEQKDASVEQKKIKECWPGILAAKNSWLWRSLKKIKNENVQKEYYLNSLVEIAVQEGKQIATAKIANDYETLGINTPEQYQIAKKTLNIFEKEIILRLRSK